MISEKSAKSIVGQILIEKFGREFIEEHKNKIGLSYQKEKGKLTINVDLYTHELDGASSVLEDGEIHVEETDFPDAILSVEVNRKDGSYKILD